MSEQSVLLSRRKMVLAGAAALGAVGAVAARPALTRRIFGPQVGRVPGPVAPVLPEAPPLGAMSNWSAALGNDFYIRTLSGSVLSTLTAVSAFPASGARPKELARQEAFTLFFDTGRVPAPPGEGIYTVTHRTLGEMQIFLSASTVSATGLTAVFN